MHRLHPLHPPPTHKLSPLPPFCAAAGSDLLIVSRAAFAPWARNADAPLNEYYNNHNSNTVAFHRRVNASTHPCMHARKLGGMHTQHMQQRWGCG